MIYRRLLCAIFVARTENLTKLYNNRIGIDSLTLEVEPGEVFGFLGLDGAGKTTTIRLLMDLIRPTSGRALLFGMDSHAQSVHIRKLVGYLPAQLSLPRFTNGANVLRYFSNLRGGVPAGKIEHFAERLNVNLNVPIQRLDESDTFKIGLVQALMHDPELLILDEPTRFLDDAGREALYEIIAEVRREGRTVFISSRSLGEMERIADRVGVIHRGKLVTVERGVHLRAKAFREVELQFAGPVPHEVFESQPSLRNLRWQENRLHCFVTGDPQALLELARKQNEVMDFKARQPSLEEAFSQYYGVGYAG